MATYRCGVVAIVGLLLMGPQIVCAQQNSTGALTYDQMMAQQQQAQAQKAAAAAKHSKLKKADAAAASETVAATTPGAGTVAATAIPAAAAASTGDTNATSASVGAVSGGAAAAAAPAAATETPAGASTADASAETADVPPTAATATSLKPVKIEKGKGKPKVKKEKPPKLVPVDIVHGELTVDGLIAKAGLNFQIIDIRYFYIWVPGLGTTLVSNQAFAGSKLEENALDGNTLTVTVDNHKLQLACDRPMLVTKSKKKEKPVNMYVAIDRNWQKPSNYPEFGYGDLPKAPYSWPGTLADLNPAVKAPPLPDNLKQHPESVKMCGKDGDPSSCRQVSVPLVLGKNS